MAIDRAARLPVHAQLHDELRALILSGELASGEKLPSELELAERFGVNRLTVRQALAELGRAGLVVPRQGVGTFVARRVQPFDVEISPADWAVEHERGARAAAEQGRVMVETLLDVAEVEAPAEVAEHLGKGRMLWLETLYTVDGEPSIRSQYWARSPLTPQQVRERGAGGFGHTVLRDIVGNDMFYAWRSFDAAPASRRDASVLEVPTGAPLLRRCGLNTDAVGRPLLYIQRDAPSGRMRFVLRSQPPAVD